MVEYQACTRILGAKTTGESGREAQVNSGRHPTEFAGPATGVVETCEKLFTGEA